MKKIVSLRLEETIQRILNGELGDEDWEASIEKARELAGKNMLPFINSINGREVPASTADALVGYLEETAAALFCFNMHIIRKRLAIRDKEAFEMALDTMLQAIKERALNSFFGTLETEKELEKEGANDTN